MTENQPFSSQEIEQLVTHWQFCRFIDMETNNTIISLPHFELYYSKSRQHCNPEALLKIKAALSEAYDQGVRHVGMFAPQALRVQIISAALDVSTDPNWRITRLWEPTYFKNMLMSQQKMWAEELSFAELELTLQKVEKEMCDRMGFTEDVLIELWQYRDAKSVKELPPHLRRLFADDQEE